MLSQHLETDHLIFERGGVGKFRIKKLCNPRRQKKRYLAYKKNQRECSKKKFPTRGKNTLCSTLTGKKISCLFACAKIFLQTNPKIKWCAPYSLKGRWILYIYIYIYIWRRKACRSNNRVVKCDVTKIKICELMRFVEIIREIKTKNVSLPRISM